MEGVLVNLCTKGGMIPLRLPGLAYVASTRVKSFDGFARRGLPIMSKFLQFREHTHHKNRVEYEIGMGELHEKFTRSQGISPEEEELELH